MVPLQIGIPGGPELLVILLMMLILFGVPLFLLGVGGFAYLRMNASDDTQERIAELEAEIDHLKHELDAGRDDDQAASDGGTGDRASVDSSDSEV
jgi:sec-independent protein translocase protein TatA